MLVWLPSPFEAFSFPRYNSWQWWLLATGQDQPVDDMTVEGDASSRDNVIKTLTLKSHNAHPTFILWFLKFTISTDYAVFNSTILPAMTYLRNTAVFNARNKSLFVSSFFIACTIARYFQCLNRLFRRFVLNPGASYRHTAVVHNQRLKYTSLIFLKLNVCFASEKNYFLAITRNAYTGWFFWKRYSGG